MTSFRKDMGSSVSTGRPPNDQVHRDLCPAVDDRRDDESPRQLRIASSHGQSQLLLLSDTTSGDLDNGRRPVDNGADALATSVVRRDVMTDEYDSRDRRDAISAGTRGSNPTGAHDAAPTNDRRRRRRESSPDGEFSLATKRSKRTMLYQYLIR